MLPPLPFHGRELASLTRALLPLLAGALAVLAAIATVVTFLVVFAQLLTVAPPRVA